MVKVPCSSISYLVILAALVSSHDVAAQVTAPPDSAATAADGQHDFDFELGTWIMHRRRLLQPLTGSTTWAASDGDVHIVRPLWDGRACIAELKLVSPTPHFAGSLLHLYNPRTREWSLSWVSSEGGTVAAPMVGRFASGRGEFFDQEPFNGATVFVRVVYSDITPVSFRTERAFSNDGGKSWEVNAIDTYTRQKP